MCELHRLAGAFVGSSAARGELASEQLSVFGTKAEGTTSELGHTEEGRIVHFFSGKFSTTNKRLEASDKSASEHYVDTEERRVAGNGIVRVSSAGVGCFSWKW